MGAFLLVIIMTSGFMFTSRYPLARFKQLRSEGWDQYLHVFAWGLPFATVSLCITCFLYWCLGDIDFDLDKIWVGSILSKEFSLYIFLWSFISIVLAWRFGEYISKKESFVNDATIMCATENQFKQRIYEATENGNFIQVTLTNKKVYIGYIKTFMELKNPDTKFIKICPFFSGYKTEKKQLLKLTNNYCKYFPDIVFNEEYEQEQMKKIIDEELEPYTVILPVKNIVSLAYWNDEYYSKVNGSIK